LYYFIFVCLILQSFCNVKNVLVPTLAALKFCFKTCVAMKFVDDDDDDDDDDDITAFC